ncbi:branched-chain amino acid aminotransferase [Thermanaerovibrio acidaminovorans DSM 6589]|jgi:branched-chain amino acid aminotransferase|uniref:Branched-chain-amino-acid aminotransferase n=1 Tax=Thermanaerovibrio acidaminovorans (strain ATCC 49978 / DSM 6589 / Su883) TaxID=525903 RepID=D1B745_THEAS|nr:branched-chain-amino-acid transaminase [Thermanaerovibrio acidaminovorans]ACZ19836.1 branched-chain amino acid aminotransferase [Thermanaerovibrio acidaminovorans DSM 6589]
MLVYVNGELLPKDEAKVSVFDHGYLYGDGVFEGIRAYRGRIFRLKEHLDRLYDSAKAICLSVPLAKEEMREVCVKTCRANGIVDGYIRLVVSRGEGDLGLNPHKAPKPTVVCIAATIQMYPEEMVRRGLNIITAATRRSYGEVLSPQVKSCNYLPNIMAVMEALNAGAQEAVCMSREGYVAECTGDNIFVVKDRVVKTPHPSCGILKGVTRDAVIQLAREMGLEVEEGHLTRYDLYTADEIFLTGTAAEVVPVGRIDGRPVGEVVPGELTMQLREAFQQLVQREGHPIYD